jgi:DNA-binding SARP family transcriptional activator
LKSISTATEFKILGPLVAVHHGRRVSLRSGKQRVLLASLLVNANRVTSNDELIGRLWDGDRPKDALSALHVYVARLRAQFKREAPDAAPLIQTRTGGYLMALPSGALDFLRFLDAIDRARRARQFGDTHEELAQINEALSEWRGDPLALIPSASLQRDVAPHMQDRRLHLVERRFDIELELGRHTEMIAEIRPWASQHPFHERFWHQLMRALYLSGRQAEALGVYLTVRGLLDRELGIRPSGELNQLYQAILTSPP